MLKGLPSLLLSEERRTSSSITRVRLPGLLLKLKWVILPLTGLALGGALGVLSGPPRALRVAVNELRVKRLREIPHWWILGRCVPPITGRVRSVQRPLLPRQPPPLSRVRHERVRQTLDRPQCKSAVARQSHLSGLNFALGAAFDSIPFRQGRWCVVRSRHWRQRNSAKGYPPREPRERR